MAILKVVAVVLESLVVLNLLIFVHELGHFLAARWRGLKIDRFAIWFGKPLWKKKVNDIEYALGWIPAGGYVALPQMATMEMIEGKSDNSSQPLPAVSPLDKIIVAFAGPLFSFLLAVAFAFLVWGVGRPEQSTKDSTTIGWVMPDGPAWKAGLRPGDRIETVDGHPVTQFVAASPDSVTWRIVTSEGTNIAIKYVRDGKQGTAYAVPYKAPTKWYERKSLRKVLISPAYPATIADVVTNSPAALAGLRPDDEVVAMNGEKIFSPDPILWAQQMLTNDPNKPLTLTVKRGQEEFERTLVAAKPVKPVGAKPSFGLYFWGAATDEVLVHPDPVSQIKDSAGTIVATLGTVLSRKSDVGIQQLGGPVMIVRAYSTFMESENGWRRVLWFSVVLNVNLALLNLLPFPVLDGGHIALAVVERIRRRPVNPKFLELLQSSCAALLIAFMLFIAFFDTGDWVRSARSNREAPLVFAPKQ